MDRAGRSGGPRRLRRRAPAVSGTGCSQLASRRSGGSPRPRWTSWSRSTSGPPPTCPWCAAARPTRRWWPGCPGWCSQARAAAHARRPGSRWPRVGRFFAVSFPLEVYRAGGWLAGVARRLHPARRGTDRDRRRRAGGLRQPRRRSTSWSRTPSRPTTPSTRRRTSPCWCGRNNAWIAAHCLAAGVLILPVLFVLWVRHAINIGMVGGVMVAQRPGGHLLRPDPPHGLLELTAIFIAAGVGLRIGWAWIAPGPHLTRGRALAEAGPLRRWWSRSGLVLVLLRQRAGGGLRDPVAGADAGQARLRRDRCGWVSWRTSSVVGRSRAERAPAERADAGPAEPARDSADPA